ncbi:helix-turn-helix domain-containing protein [Kineococcus sp. NUM-3379]
MDLNEPWKTQTTALGSFIRAQRQLADLSLRELATLSKVSNAYLSQVERGLHQPSVRVLGSIAQALGVPFDALLTEAGLRTPGGRTAPTPAPEAAEGSAGPQARRSTEEAILADPALTPEQRQALLGVYRSFLGRDG